MTKQDFVNKIINTVWGDTTERENLRKYIVGEIDTKPDSSKLHTYVTYGHEFGGLCAFDEDYISRNGLEDVSDELKEISRRFFEAFENRLLFIVQRLEYVSNRYKYYNLMGENKQLVRADLINLGGTPFRTGKINNVGLQNLDTCLHEAEKYYSDVIYEMVSNYDVNLAFNSAGIVFLIKKLAEKDERYIKFIDELEKITCYLLKLSFDKKDVESAFDSYIHDENIKNYYNKSEKVIIAEEQEKNRELLLMFISAIGVGISPIIDACLKVFYIVCDYNFIHYKLDNDDFFNIADKLKLPNESIIKYCLIGYRDAPVNTKQKYLDKLKYVFDSDTQCFKDCLDKYIDIYLNKTIRKDIFMCTTLAFLLKADKLNNDEKNYYIEKVENIIIKYIKEGGHDGGPVCKFNDDSSYNFDSFKNTDFPCDEAFAVINTYHSGFQSLVKLCLFLTDYSRVARNVAKFTYANSRYWTYYICNYEEFCYKDMEINTYKRLYKIGFSLNSIIEMFIREKTMAYNYLNLKEEEENKKEFLEFLKEHKFEAEQGVETFQFSNTEIAKKYIEILYEKDNGFDMRYIVKAFLKKSKPIAEYVEKLLINRENEVRPYVEELLEIKNKIANDAATRLIRIWDNEKIKEKLDTIQDLDSMVKYIESIYTKNNEKNVPYLDEVDYENVRTINLEEKVPAILMKYYISEYIMLKELYVINTCKKIEEFIDLYDFRKLLKSIFEVWTSDGYKAKYKNIIIPMAITATENQIAEMKKQIDFWTENSKPSLATFAVQGLAMNKSKLALLLLDTMSKKHKNKKVKTAALEAMELAAKELNITRDELDDLIVPDLGFDSERKRMFDYGERKFKAVLNDKLEITLSDSTGKEIKSLPKASAKYNDNEGMVNTCKEDLKLIKKQVKTVFDTQKPRISSAIMSGRKWNVDTWKKLFIQNPLMTAFAIGLVWEELDENNDIIGTFRYMEDGTFNTSDEEEYQVSENSSIRLLHPVDIDEEELNSWKEQFEDYEIVQPINQLYIPIYTLNEDNSLKTEIDDFKGKKVYGATFKNIASKLDLTLCFSGDCDGCMFKYSENNIVMRFYTELFYISDYTSVTTLKNIIFYIENENKDNELSNLKHLTLQEVPPKLLSFAKFVGDTITVKTLE